MLHAEQMSGARETDLVRRAQLGDRLALGSLLEQHQPQLWRFTERMCRTRHDAEDVLQEALASAVRDFHGYRGEASLRTWLFSIARHACAKFYARAAPAQAEATAEGALDESDSNGASKSGPSTPEATASERELAGAVLRAIDELPDAQREALVLRDVEGLSAAEVAHVTQSSVEAVKSRLHRARRSVQRRAMEIAEPRLLEPVGAITPRSCPDILQLYSERLEGDVSQQLCERIQEHVDGCDSCRSTCDGLKQTLAACQAVPLGPVPDRIQRAVALALHAPNDA